MFNVLKIKDGAVFTVTYANGVIGSVPKIDGNIEYEEIKVYIASGGVIEPEFTEVELLQQVEDAKPKVVTMRQARLALLQSGLLTTITDAIANGTDEALKIEWEYAADVRRDWPSLIAVAASLGLTSVDLDNLFQLASTL